VTDRLSALLDHSSPSVSDFGPLATEFARHISATQAAARRRALLHRRTAIFLAIGAIVFSGATTAAASPAGEPAKAPHFSAMLLGATRVTFDVSYKWTSHAGRAPSACVMRDRVELDPGPFGAERTRETVNFVRSYFARLDATGLERTAEFRDAFGLPRLGHWPTPSRREGEEVREVQALSQVAWSRLQHEVTAHHVSAVSIQSTGDWTCANGTR
jgi:hypothetical protein